MKISGFTIPFLNGLKRYPNEEWLLPIISGIYSMTTFKISDKNDRYPFLSLASLLKPYEFILGDSIIFERY
jgi:hypothetical protein